jgi:hypothetical protein
MQNTHFHDDHTMIVPNRAVSYNPAGYNVYKIAVLSYANVGATSLFTTVEDMAKWDQEFYEGKVFGKDVIEEMHTKGVLNNGEELDYAYGLVIEDYKGLKSVQHSGGDAGYRTHLLRFPDQHFSVVVFSNLGTVSPVELAKKVADLYLADQIKQETEEETVIELPVEKLEKFSGLYFEAETQAQYNLELRDGKLFIPMGPGLELEAISEKKLRVKQFRNVHMEFVDTPQVQQMKLHWSRTANPDTLEKVEVPVLSKDQLEEYAGLYTSPELEVSYRLIVKDDKLAIQRRKYGIVPLRPSVKDSFGSDHFNLSFYRNTAGAIEGVKLYSGRVLGLRFIKSGQ